MDEKHSIKPIVGVTGPVRGGAIAWLMTSLALRRVGAKVVRITPNVMLNSLNVDAFVIGGGSDVEPWHYGEEPHDEVIDSSGEEKDERFSLVDYVVSRLITLLRAIFALHSMPRYDLERDTLEKQVILEALAQGAPVLGICRGAQLMNIVLGGSLHQKIDHFYTETPRVRSVLPAKKVQVRAESRLFSLLNATECHVNALHDQSVNLLGEGIVVAASEGNGVIQAIEKQQHVFYIGVQWHPEYMPQSRRQLNLFRGLVSAAIDTQRYH